MASTLKAPAHHTPSDLEEGSNSTRTKGEKAQPTEAEPDKETPIHLHYLVHHREGSTPHSYKEQGERGSY
ncbi:hypothetical protein L195_g006177 [Trifolium pratense]|uniref:Uncharacterized protein n=1 Tax=Trifolium pratense TaxID=57577 RepID=A0A2K3P311_TRIPR|nr:hypothetical protein L195_g006177 [Trifolium pratense]